MRSTITTLAFTISAIFVGALTGYLVLPSPKVPETVVANKAATPMPESPEEPLATPEPTGTPAPLPPGASRITFSQYAVNVVATDPVRDLTYDMVGDKDSPVVGLSTRTFISKYPDCLPSSSNNVLGQIVRKKRGQKTYGVLIKQVGSYDYFYRAPSGFCVSDQAGKNALAAARAAVKNAVLPTLSN